MTADFVWVAFLSLALVWMNRIMKMTQTTLPNR
jgi:hypothetical protein